jgi:hypothetical protein
MDYHWGFAGSLLLLQRCGNPCHGNGRISSARAITVTKSEILTGLNRPDDFILAIVEVNGEKALAPRYIRKPFGREPDFGVTSVNYDLDELLARAEEPA